MWTHPMEPQVKLPGGRETCVGCAEMGAGTLWTHPLGPLVELPGWLETCEGCTEIDAGAPCARTRWGHMWRSLGGTKRVRDVPKWARGCHVDAPTGAIGDVPCGARSA